MEKFKSALIQTCIITLFSHAGGYIRHTLISKLSLSEKGLYLLLLYLMVREYQVLIDTNCRTSIAIYLGYSAQIDVYSTCIHVCTTLFQIKNPHNIILFRTKEQLKPLQFSKFSRDARIIFASLVIKFQKMSSASLIGLGFITQLSKCFEICVGFLVKKFHAL